MTEQHIIEERKTFAHCYFQSGLHHALAKAWTVADFRNIRGSDKTIQRSSSFLRVLHGMQGHVGSLKQQPVKKLAHRECDPETQRARENNVEHNGKKTGMLLVLSRLDWTCGDNIFRCYTSNFATRCQAVPYINMWAYPDVRLPIWHQMCQVLPHRNMHVNIFRCYTLHFATKCQVLQYRNMWTYSDMLHQFCHQM